MSRILELQAQQNTGPKALSGTDKRWLDGDTLAGPGGERYRLQGYDAGEVEKIVGDGQLKFGTAGGQETTDIVAALANSQGYNNIKPILGADGQPKIDPAGGRILAELANDKGESFNQQLINAGAFDINHYNTAQQIFQRDRARAERERQQAMGVYKETEFDKAAALINAAELKDGEKQLGFKMTALNEAEYANQYYQLINAGYTEDQAKEMLGGAYQNITQVDNFDVNLMNQSNNPLSDAWDQGWIGAKEGAYGMLNLLGEEFDNEWLADLGEDGIKNMQLRQEEMGSILTDYKDVEDFSSAMQFLGNNIAMSLPYMAITAGGAVVGAAGGAAVGAAGAGALAAGAVGTGVGLSAPASVYAGQTWNEMEGDKNAGVAIGAGLVQASLDRLGLGGLAGKIVPDRAFQQGVKHIMQKQGVTEAVAKDILSNATRVEARHMMRDAIKIGNQQITAKTIGKDLLKRASIDAVAEGGTEVGQEATAYLAATMGSDKTFDWNELNSRMVSALVAGSAIGGAIAVPGSARQSVQEADLIYGGEKATKDTASVSQQYANELQAQHGYVPTVSEGLADAMKLPDQGFETMRDRASKWKQGHNQKSTFKKITEAALDPGQFLRGATATIFTPSLQERSPTARLMADMFGGNLQKVYAGASFENEMTHNLSTLKNMVAQPNDFYKVMGRGQKINKALKQRVSSAFYEKANAALDKDGNFDPNLIPDTDPDKQMIVRTVNELNAMSDKMYNDQKKFNPELGYQKNYLLKAKSLDKNAVKDNQKEFQELLKSTYNMDPTEAKRITDEIIANPEANNIDEAFSVIHGGFSPGSHKKRSLGMSEKKEFQKFMEQDLFANISNAAKSASRYQAHQKFIGKNGEVVSKLLDQMQKEGVPEAEVDKVAAQLQDYLDAQSGNYKRPQTERGKKAQAVQKNLMTFMTLAGLPLATVSSFVELMLVNRGLTSDQVWGKDGSMKSMGKELGHTLWSGATAIAQLGTKKEIEYDPKTEARQKLREIGHYEWDVGAATVTGVTEVNATQQKLYEDFFKYTGLTGWTNYTRAARASMGADYMRDNAEIYHKYKLGGEYTRDVQQAEEKLRNLGIDPDRFSDIQTKITAGVPLNPQEEAFWGESIKEGTFNFVNEAIALPQAANRPLIYQDPRFALFTQFQGFIATFTANHIPKLWGEYVKRGTPAMKYNAFATAATMIMMGFASQYLKDIIKYTGDEEEYDFETFGNPYLDTSEYARRGLAASGLLGVAERPLNFFFPIYEQRSSGPGDWAFNTVVGESPALSWLQRTAGAGGNLLKGDVGRATEQAFKAAPIFGPFSWVNKKIGGVAEHWNFNGEE